MWKFNNTIETVDIPQAQVTSDHTRSVTTYTPTTELDYGTLLCWGSNDQGSQIDPCVFHIVPAGKFFRYVYNGNEWEKVYIHTTRQNCGTTCFSMIA